VRAPQRRSVEILYGGGQAEYNKAAPSGPASRRPPVAVDEVAHKVSHARTRPARYITVGSYQIIVIIIINIVIVVIISGGGGAYGPARALSRAGAEHERRPPMEGALDEMAQ
jgi:hypothetical protein